VTKEADVQQMITSAVTRYGGLDYAFNNAGLVGSNAGIVETSEEDWHRVMATTLTGVWLCMKYEIPEIVEARRGRDRK
jgi:NAD(P)-dependent dehydrogenase (short-subunit alcohol dehydrogenase family)